MEDTPTILPPPGALTSQASHGLPLPACRPPPPPPFICYCLTLRQTWRRGKAAAALWCVVRVILEELLRNGDFFSAYFPAKNTYTAFVAPSLS